VSEISWSRVCQDNGAASGARAEARSYLERYTDPNASELNDSEQIIGELIANVVRHGAPPFGMRIDWRDERPTFYITDCGDAKPLVYAVPDRDAENGRGLLIVRALGGEFVVHPPSPERSGMRIAVQLPVCRPYRAAA
jgi:anti-sigma regulatory factor (Ser/Thr protein kinase)